MIEDVTRGEGPELPEWVEPDKDELKGADDLLGLRTYSKQIRDRWLNGATRYTPLLRYISLLTWFTHVYHQKCYDGRLYDFLRAYRNFEAAIALSNLHLGQDPGGLVGVQRGKREYEALEAETKECVYISNGFRESSGYASYISAARALGLLMTSEGRAPSCSDTGTRLALAIEQDFTQRGVVGDLNSLVSEERLLVTMDDLDEYADALIVSWIPRGREHEFLRDLLIPSDSSLQGLGGDEVERADHVRRAATCGLLLDVIESNGPRLEKDRQSVFKETGVDEDEETYGVKVFREEVLALEPTSADVFASARSAWSCVTLMDSLAYRHEQCLRQIVSVLRDEFGEGCYVERLEVINVMYARLPDDKFHVMEHYFGDLGIATASLAEFYDTFDKELASAFYGFPTVLYLLPSAIPLWCLLSWNDLGVTAVKPGDVPTLANMMTVFAEEPMGLVDAVERVCVFVANRHHKHVYEQLSGANPKDVMVLVCEGRMWMARPGVGEVMNDQDPQVDSVSPRLKVALEWLRQLHCITDEGYGLTPLGAAMRDRARDLLATTGGAL